MRWLNERIRDDRGATAVMVGLLMVPLIGFLAIALDVGALYAERAQLQNGADAAALAIANDCALDDSCDNAAGLSQTFANANANDAAANVGGINYPTANSVRVVTSTRDAATGDAAMRHPFAAMIGTEFSTVEAEATAEWGSPVSSATVLPLAVSLCEFERAIDVNGIFTGELQLFRIDMNTPCPGPDGHPIPGGFGWLDLVATGECSGIIERETLPSRPGIAFPNTPACNAVLTSLEGSTIIVPIFDGGTGTGAGGTFRIHGFAAFEVTGWRFTGGRVNVDPAAPACTGSCQGIQGRFVEWVSPDAAGVEIGGPDLGVTIIRLSR
ncbi:pilus assembly protein TadG-related protein [Mycetocola sp. 2940]|uniref:TadE/TadG family type IV pilus assembly protein n=1 Tax=Mycetocola sp. 2940 TaxID=3156452 RepID=UPI003396D7A0